MVGAKVGRLLGLDPIVTRHKFDRRDTILYALGIGCGLLGDDELELKYVLEDRLEAFPTIATVLGYPGFWFDREDLGLDWRRILLRAQYLTLERPLPVEGQVVGVTRVIGAKDRGEGNGALIAVERQIYDDAGGSHLATCSSVIALRGDGENSGTEGAIPPRLPAIHGARELHNVTLRTIAGQPLIYRLSGDRNPVHADPDVARAVGFARPIMHGLCTFGMAARTIVKAACGGDGKRLRTFHAELVGPVAPGDDVTVHILREAQGRLRLNATSRGAPVLANGIVGISA